MNGRAGAARPHRGAFRAACVVALVVVTVLAFQAPTALGQSATGSYAAGVGGGVAGTYGGMYTAPDTGGATLSVASPYAAVVVTADDMLAGAHAPIQVCAGQAATGAITIAPPQPVGCTGLGCGAAYLGFATPEDEITVFVFASYVSEDLNWCQGTTGDLYADFF